MKSYSYTPRHKTTSNVDFKVKHLVSKTNDRPKQIHQIQFGTLTCDEVSRTSEIHVTSGQLFVMPSRAPAPNGCLDPRLGISDKVSKCQTCDLSLQDCAGHFGYIKLALPVFHIGYFKHIYSFLQCICKTCSRVLLSEGVGRDGILRRMRGTNLDNLQREILFSKGVHEKCKKAKQCPHCGAINGQVKKLSAVPTLKLVHDKYKGRHAEDELENLVNSLQSTLSLQNGSMSSSAPAYVEDLLPTTVLELFKRISDEDCELLGVRPHSGRPENMIIEVIAVPPVAIRPSVAMDMGGGSNEDDLTVQLQEIINVNVALELALTKGPATKLIIESWDILQVEVAKYINTDMPGVQKPMGAKPIRGLCQRLKGKQGRFRGNLSGKRVDFSARTVISPDPNLAITQVGVPVHVAKIMTFPEMVNRYNINRLRALVRNGPHVHPGANLIQVCGSNLKKSLAFADDLNSVALSLKVGDIVERHMQDGDFVLFNRQPSLHRLSIMCHQVKVMPWRTFRFNIQVCAPYNADFDGDEMNLHLIQTHEARSEAKLLMSTVNNLVTPRNGEPLISASQDYLTCSYILTQKDQFFDREEFCSFLAYTCLAEEHIMLPPPTIRKPVNLWTGKQIFSVLVRGICDNLGSAKGISFECKEKNYTSNKHFCLNDGYVCFMDSELLSGNIAKKTIGDGTKKGLIYVLLRDLGSEQAAEFMNKFSRLCSRVMGMHKGLSIGVDDVTPSAALTKIKHSILKDGFREAMSFIKKYEDGTLPLRPGCNILQSLEEMMNGVLGKLRESAGQRAMKALHWHNAPRIMAECGSKGSPLNISQMIACVGQQAVGGQRIANGFVNRTLPHFPYNSLTPGAKGFVGNSFYTGLTPTEFIFHAMGGREGLVDTAVKTAETGYMSRRLMKALEDLSLRYDYSVRNSEDIVVQFTYGDDNLNPEMMEANDRPVDFDRLYLSISQTNPCRNENMIHFDEVVTIVQSKLEDNRFQALLPLGQVFHDEILSYFEKITSKQKKLFTNGVPTAEAEQRCWNSCRFTETQLDLFLSRALEKYNRSYVEPGDAIGATGAMSIGEPATQMTLKTFHFAGVSSMNVTLGVPRVKEIINAAKEISTPIITARLVKDDNAVGARVVKAGIEKTTLGEVASSIKEVYSANTSYLTVKLDMDAIDQLKLDIDAVSVRRSILNLNGSKSRSRPQALRALTHQHVKLKKGSKSKLRVYIPKMDEKGGSSTTSIYFAMQALKAALPQVIVKGIHTVNRAVINEEDSEDGSKSFHLLVEGYGLSEVMGSPGVDGTNTTTNHVIEILHTLGIEAARSKISAEIFYIMNAYGIGIDSRHLLLLSDVMTFKGEVLGITRFGVAKMRESVLMLASFEKPTDHLFDAAVRGKTDSIVGVSECIIMGVPIPMGTGLFKLLKKASEPMSEECKVPRRLLLGGEKAFLHN